MSHVPALLFDGALPMSTKKLEPGSGLLTGVICMSDTWMAVKPQVLDGFIWYS